MHPKAVFLGRATEELVKAIATANMVDLLSRGQRVVIGTLGPAEEGQTVTRVRSGGLLVVKRRATRQEFLDACPLEDERDRAGLTAPSAPFYYELELLEGESIRTARIQ